MLKILKAFQKSLLLFIKVALILSLFLIFYLFYKGESDELRRGMTQLTRVSAIVSSTFLLVCYVMTRIYGGFAIGRRRTKEIAISMFLAAFITDGFTYIQLCIMEKRIMKLSILAAVFIVQVVVIILLTKLSNNIYYRANPPRRLLIIHNNPEKLEVVVDKLKAYQNRYKIEKIMSFDDEMLHRSIKSSNSVLLVDLPPTEKEAVVEYCYKRGKEVYFTPSIADIMINNATHELIDDISILAYEAHGLTIEQRMIKRAADFLLSLTALVLTSPIFLAQAIAIRFEDGGPVFFKQQRTTKGGRFFNVLKFRTMIVGAEKHRGAVLAEHGDKRITKVGRVLRKTRLDELPQLINILRGDMSIVGPRPERPELTVEYEKNIPEFCYRSRVKAGLTGLAQIMGRYNTTPKDKLVLDLIYIEQYSLRLDLKIMFQTVVVCLTPEKSEGSKKPTAKDIKKLL